MILQCSELRKRFGRTVALDGVSLELRRGEILGLLGPNGAGKSTLVRTIAGRVHLDGGSIRINGTEALPGAAGPRRSVGWIPQDLALYPLLSVEENLRTFARYHGLSPDVIDGAVESVLEWSGLAERRHDVTRTLSGGMKRRLNMAAGVIHRPEIVLLDEPTVGVDPQSRERIYQMIEGMRSDAASVIYTTHYMEEAERLCDRISIIDSGKIIASGTWDELALLTTGGKRKEACIELSGEVPGQLVSVVTAAGGTVVGNVLSFPVEDVRRDLERIFLELDAAGVEVLDVAVRTPTLEAVFLDLTGRELRD